MREIRGNQIKKLLNMANKKWNEVNERYGWWEENQ